MSTKRKSLTPYNVMAEMTVTVGIIIDADSLEDAVQKSKDLKETDFITIEGEYIDGTNFHLTGVYV